MKNRQRTILPILSLFVLALAVLLAAPLQAQPTPKDKVKAEGTLAVEGECQILTAADGQQFALVGDLQGAASGDRIRVSGTVGERTTCVQGTTILVESVKTDKSMGEERRTDVVHVTGTLTDEGVECQALRGDDGQLYTLTGDLGGFSNGDRVKVTGKVAEVSICQQGTTLSVLNVNAAK